MSSHPNLSLVEVDAGHDIGGDNPGSLLAEVSRLLDRLERAR